MHPEIGSHISEYLVQYCFHGECISISFQIKYYCVCRWVGRRYLKFLQLLRSLFISFRREIDQKHEHHTSSSSIPTVVPGTSSVVTEDQIIPSIIVPGTSSSSMVETDESTMIEQPCCNAL